METNYDSDYQIRLATLGALGGDVTKEYDSVYEIDLEILRLTSQGGGTSYTAGTGIDITEDTISVDSSLLTTINGKAEKVDFVIPVNMQTQVTDWTVLNNATEGIYRVKVVADMMGTSITMLEGWATVTNSMGTIAQTLVLTQMIPSAQGSPLTIHNRVSVNNGTTWNDYEFNLGVINDSHSSTESTYSSNKIESLISALDQRLTAIGG